MNFTAGMVSGRPPGRNEGSCPKNFVSPPQLAVLPLQLPEPLPHQGGHSRSQTPVHPRPPHPPPERLLGQPQPGRDRLNRCPLRVVTASVLQHRPHPPIPAAPTGTSSRFPSLHPLSELSLQLTRDGSLQRAPAEGSVGCGYGQPDPRQAPAPPQPPIHRGAPGRGVRLAVGTELGPVLLIQGSTEWWRRTTPRASGPMGLSACGGPPRPRLGAGGAPAALRWGSARAVARPLSGHDGRLPLRTTPCPGCSSGKVALAQSAAKAIVRMLN